LQSYSQAGVTNYTPDSFPSEVALGNTATSLTGMAQAAPGSSTEKHNINKIMTTPYVPHSNDRMVVLGHLCVPAASDLADEVVLKQNTSPVIAADLYDFAGLPGTDPATAGKQGAFNQRRIAVTAAANLRRAAVQQGREFNARAVNHLKTFLGRRWNPLWQSIGFTNGSIALPGDPMPLLLKLRPHFIANPAHELATEGITAAQANSLTLSINAAFNAESTAVAARDAARDARDLSAAKLRTRLVGLRSELEQLLADDDHRWRRFGFSRPVDRRIPAVVTGLTLRPGGLPGELIVEWQPSVGAESYRVMCLVQTVDASPLEVGLFTDRTAIISGLPGGSTVVVSVSARNEAGETLPTSASILVA
jgi:hypothetical protein